jgi:hypothetical protein
MKNDYPISQLRLVKVIFGEGKTTSEHVHYMHESQVETFIAATVALHHSPGINPHNGIKTASLWEIKVCELGEQVSYWWCDPTLMKNHSAQGAQINQAKWSICFLTDRKWAHPDLLRKEKEQREADAKAEYEYNLQQIQSDYK